MDIKSKTFETEDEWLAFRADYINSTDCAALLRQGQWSSFYKLWHIKHGDIEDDFKETELTKSGKRYEACTAEHFAENYSCEVGLIKEYRYSDEYRIGSSFDFEVLSGKYNRWILETKRCTSFSTKRWENNEPPLQYTLQCHHQMALSPEVPGVVLCVLKDGWELEIFEVKRDQRVIDLIKRKSVEFWGTIERDEAPEIDLDDLETVNRVHAINDGEIIESTTYIEELASQLEQAKEKVKINEKIEKEVKSKIKAETTATRVRLKDGRALDLGTQNGSSGTIITKEMIGETIGAKKSYRRCMFRGKKNESGN